MSIAQTFLNIFAVMIGIKYCLRNPEDAILTLCALIDFPEDRLDPKSISSESVESRMSLCYTLLTKQFNSA
jgi:hypothetical protein